MCVAARVVSLGELENRSFAVRAPSRRDMIYGRGVPARPATRAPDLRRDLPGETGTR
jgi:hypothetical protein